MVSGRGCECQLPVFHPGQRATECVCGAVQRGVGPGAVQAAQEMAMGSQHYSLRWNNHQSHVLTAVDTLLQNEALVDVTIMCEEQSVRAHKVVLSACSPYFQRMFTETPCKHPVVVLKDIRGWELQAIVDFMYKGEISVAQDQLAALIRAAEGLQVRGLAHTDRSQMSPPSPSPPPQSSTPKSPNPALSLVTNRAPTPSSNRTPTPNPRQSVSPLACVSPVPSLVAGSSACEVPPPQPKTAHSATGAPHANGSAIPFLANASGTTASNDNSTVEHRTSPLPRRKQARPRRRSGDYSMAESNKTSSPVSDILSSPNESQLLKKSTVPIIPVSVKAEVPDDSIESCLQETLHERPDFPSPLDIEAALENCGMSPGTSISSLSLNTTAQDRVSPFNAIKPSDCKMSPGRPYVRNFRGKNSTPESQTQKKKRYFQKKHLVGRGKGQHSAPRGGPPRSWTNHDLTEALQNVWNKKMTTSQASRVFGIPYNSLLMYVRGKYGKSLKLELLRQASVMGANENMAAAVAAASEAANRNLRHLPNVAHAPSLASMGISMASLGPSKMGEDNGPDSEMPFNPFNNFYPDYSYPVPVNMVHLLPQSEKNRDYLSHLASSPFLSSMADANGNAEMERAPHSGDGKEEALALVMDEANGQK